MAASTSHAEETFGLAFRLSREAELRSAAPAEAGAYRSEIAQQYLKQLVRRAGEFAKRHATGTGERLERSTYRTVFPDSSVHLEWARACAEP